MKAALAVIIFTIAYYFMATEKINKTIVAILGATLVISLKLVTFEQAISAVDFNVIFLLVGMMTSVHILSKTGFFEWTAISVARLVGGEPVLIAVCLITVTAFLSAFLDNVTTIILLVPVTILLMQLLEVSPVPVIILEAIASNIGGTATLIGDPPNIVIGSQAGLSFTDFLFQLGPIVLAVFVAFLGTSLFIFKRCYSVPESVKKRIKEAIPHLAIVDAPNMIRSLVIFGFILVGFFIHDTIDVQPGMIALGGSMVMMVVCRSKSDETLMQVEWGTIFFFIGMFMMISALEVNGVIQWIGNKIIGVAGHNMFLVCILVLLGSAFFSSILDNIPFVITMVPLIKQFIMHLTGSSAVSPELFNDPAVVPLWWALSLGACLGGNGTLIGASANIVMARISERNRYRITFPHFFRYGFPFMIQSMIICSIYLYFRYFNN